MINVTVGEQKTQSEFPKLMKVSERIILMFNAKEGVQLNHANGEQPHYFDNWVTSQLEDFNEPITLQNA